MKKIKGLKRVGTLLFAMAIGATTLLSACGTEDPSSEPQTVAQTEIWSTYATAKVIRGANKNDSYVHNEAKVDIQMMKNETEGAQLVVTAGGDVNAYTLKTSDLSDGSGNVISKSDISVYHQKYHKLTSKRTTNNPMFSVGDYIPDMLLPLEIAAAYGENKIAAGENQGITVEVKTSSDTAPGTYTGTFELDLDGEKTNIPVTVEVWDIEYEGKREMQSSFLVYQSQLMTGEYANGSEVVSAYSDVLSEYKANSMLWTGQTELSDEELVEWMTEQKRLFESDNYNSIAVPYYFTASYRTYKGTELSNDALTAFKHFDTIVKASMEEENGEYVNYLDYAYMYVIHMDEADIIADRKQQAETVFAEINKTYDAYAEYLAQDEDFLALKASNPAYAEEIMEAVANISAVFVNVSYIADWVGEVESTFCTYVSTFREGHIIDRYEEAAAENSNGDLWTYIANMSLYPTPSFHTDDYNLGMRTAGWMEKSFNANGFLYWNASYYRVNGDGELDLDVYEDLDRASYVTGDGFLLYPGRKYGSDKPFASLRLATYRDGQDDYDMLCVYEKLLNEHAAEYGLGEINLSDYVQDLYDSLFEYANYATDDALIYAAREELAERILALKNEDKLLVCADKNADGTALKIYAKSATLTVNGESKTGEACGAGYVYTLAADSSARTISIQTANHSYSYGIASIEGIALTETACSTGSTVVVQDGVATASINGGLQGGETEIGNKTEMFRPYFQVKCNGLNGANILYFTIENTGSEGFDGRVELVVGVKKEIIDTFYCPAGEKKVVQMTIFDSLGIDLSKVSAINVSFKNVLYDMDGNQYLSANKTFTVSNVFIEKK